MTDHDHPHDHDHHNHVHDVNPMDFALEPPTESLLAALREQWLTDRAALTDVQEQLMVALSTVDFQNRVIDGLQQQLREAAVSES